MIPSVANEVHTSKGSGLALWTTTLPIFGVQPAITVQKLEHTVVCPDNVLVISRTWVADSDRLLDEFSGRADYFVGNRRK
jgi:hypothetical protein